MGQNFVFDTYRCKLRKNSTKIFTTFSRLVCFRSPQKSRLHLLLLLNYRQPPRSSANTATSFAGSLPVASVPPTCQGRFLASPRLTRSSNEQSGRNAESEKGRNIYNIFLSRLFPLVTNLVCFFFWIIVCCPSSATTTSSSTCSCPWQWCHQLAKVSS